MKHRLASLAAATGFGAAALVAAVPAGAQSEEPLPLTVDPPSGPVGTEVTLTGEGCLGELGPGAIEVFVDGVPVEDDDPDNPSLADETGAWGYIIVPQPGVQPGVYQVTAICVVNDGSGTVIAEYGPSPFEVTGDTTPEPEEPEEPEGPGFAEEPAPPAPATPVVAAPSFTG